MNVTLFSRDLAQVQSPDIDLDKTLLCEIESNR